MNEDLCFVLNNRHLRLDQLLVEFNNIPMLYLCKDKENLYYSVLCTDIDEETYIIVQSNLTEIVKMFQQKITMRDLFLRKDSFWTVQAGADPYSDDCEKRPICDIPYDSLPYENATFKVDSQELAQYKTRLESELYSKPPISTSTFELSIQELEPIESIFVTQTKVLIDRLPLQFLKDGSNKQYQQTIDPNQNNSAETSAA